MQPTTLEFTIDIKDWQEMVDKLENPEFIGEPLRQALTEITDVMTIGVKEKAKVDTGNLFSDVSAQVDDENVIPSEAVVGTNVPYSPFVEWDTRPHWPPWGPGSALAGWAGRHGIKAFLVARAIAQRGTRGAHMFRDTLEKDAPYINARIDEAGQEIERRWKAGAQ